MIVTVGSAQQLASHAVTRDRGLARWILGVMHRGHSRIRVGTATGPVPAGGLEITRPPELPA